jgi:broad specificity phosphatase PhoE
MDHRQKEARTLWLVEHGQTTWNSMGWVQGHVDSARFTRLGKHEIRVAADLLAEEPVAAIYSSDLLRARRTAMAIARRLKLDVRIDPRLRGRKMGIAEGTPWADVPTAASGVAGERVVDQLARPPGGESLHDVYLRCAGFLEDLAHRGHEGDVVVVAHDASARMLRAIMAADDFVGLKWGSLPEATVQPMALAWPMDLSATS